MCSGINRFLACFYLLICTPLFAADTVLTSISVREPPEIDGKSDDAAWQAAETLVTHDAIANIDIQLKSVYTPDKIYFLVSFPDSDETRLHKPNIWDAALEEYVAGPQREDTMILKWMMVSDGTDLSVYANDAYTADVWYWKANRTDPLGFADDKFQTLTLLPGKKSVKVLSKNGQVFYLSRTGDRGKSAYSGQILVEYQGDVLDQYVHRQPEGSRADVKAKGRWQAGTWTVEFERLLDTGNSDDVSFQKAGRYIFGVSRYEIAGKITESQSQYDLYGAGDTGETLTLQFAQ